VAKAILVRQRQELIKISELLLVKEVIFNADIEALLGKREVTPVQEVTREIP
jgi:hypothetical protein